MRISAAFDKIDGKGGNMEMRKSDSSGMDRVGLRRALVLAAAVLVMWACFCSSAFADTLFPIPAEYNLEEGGRRGRLPDRV